MLPYRILIAGMSICLLGAIVVTLADTWMSRLLLTYLDAVEKNLSNLTQAVRNGAKNFDMTPSDPRRDGRLDLARSLKTLGWLAMVLGFGTQMAVAIFANPTP